MELASTYDSAYFIFGRFAMDVSCSLLNTWPGYKEPGQLLIQQKAHACLVLKGNAGHTQEK